MVQVTIDMYLEPGDYRYDEYYLYLPVYNGEVYNGKTTLGVPDNINNFNKWMDKLPHEWQNTPFHTHFYYVDSIKDITDLEDDVKKILEEVYKIWAKGENVPANWKSKYRNKPKFIDLPDEQRLIECQNKIDSIKTVLADKEIK